MPPLTQCDKQVETMEEACGACVSSQEEKHK